MRGHKYIKREGSPGNYTYYYKDASGNVVAGDQEEGKKEHARRLIAGHAAGHHTKTPEEMARLVGITTRRLREHISNMRQAGRRRNAAAAEPAVHGHDFEEEHLDEAHHESAAAHVRAEEARSPSVARREIAPVRRRTPRPESTPSADRENEAARQRELARHNAEQAANDEPVTVQERREAPGFRIPPQKDRKQELREKLAREHGIHLPGESPDEVSAARTRARQSREAARAALSSPSSPTSAAARELAAVEPAFESAEVPIREMAEAAAEGENPYLKRAAEIFHRIQGDLKPERKQVASHAFEALKKLKDAGLNSGNFLMKYKELSGNRRATLDSVNKEFEKATFMTLDEVLTNAPLDLEVERMKRGYAAKQFARMKPFIKDEWHASNPSAPPPYPTFGDVKGWSAMSGPKPSWAGATRLAVPKEVFDAAIKKDGKPLYPPAWMPIHLMPVWNYVAKKDDNAYQTRTPNFQGGSRVAVGNQAQYQEGTIVAALRKYVQMRGGAEQLVDIPKSKMTEAGLTHHEIFKSEDLSDAALKKLCRYKIIDPVAFVSFMKKEVKKSFELVIDADETPMTFRKSYVVNMTQEVDLKKSMIERIKRLKDGKRSGS